MSPCVAVAPRARARRPNKIGLIAAPPSVDIYHLIVCRLQHTVFFSDRRENVKRTRHHTVHSRTAARTSQPDRPPLSAELRGTDTRQSMSPHVEWSPTHLCDISMSCALSLCHLSCLRRMAHRAARVHDLQDWILGGRVRLNEGRPCVNRNRAFRDDRLRHQAISALGPQPH